MESIPQMKLGNQGLIVPKIGLGCMGMTGLGHYDIYGKANEQEAIQEQNESDAAAISAGV